MPRYTTQSIVDALIQTNGMVYLAAKALGCDAHTIYNRMKKSPKLRRIVKEYRGQLGDIGEQKLRQAVLKGEPWAVALVVKTLCKKRGYVEKQELNHSGNVATPMTFDDWFKINEAAQDSTG